MSFFNCTPSKTDWIVNIVIGILCLVIEFNHPPARGWFGFMACICFWEAWRDAKRWKKFAAAANVKQGSSPNAGI